MARLVSKIYGEALYEFAKENKTLDDMYQRAYDVVKVFSESSDLKNFLANPKVSIDQKVLFVNDLFTHKIWGGDKSKLVDFLSIVIRKGRAKDVVYIFRYFIHLTLREKNIGEAEVTTATVLDDNKKQKLEKKLIDSTNYQKFVIDYKVDKSLIAGIKIKIDDKVFDKTYKTKIFDISKSLRGLKV